MSWPTILSFKGLWSEFDELELNSILETAFIEFVELDLPDLDCKGVAF
jgi:hypothetical protein